jgi:pimeloyl-ACP methyl ester carboxylesterase
MLACPPEVMLNDFLACDHFDLHDRLAEITLPTLVLSASADQMTPPKFGQFLANQLPRAEFALIQQAGHMMMLEFPEQVAQLVGDFMGKIGEA